MPADISAPATADASDRDPRRTARKTLTIRPMLLRFFELALAESRVVSQVESRILPDLEDVVSTYLWGQESIEFHKNYMAESYSAEPGDAIRDDDEQNPGRYKVIFRMRGGIETCYRNLAPVGPGPSGEDALAQVQLRGSRGGR